MSHADPAQPPPLIAAHPEVSASDLKGLGMAPCALAAEPCGACIRSEVACWSPLIGPLGIRLD